MNAADQRRLTPLLGALTLVLGAGVLLMVAGIGRGVHWDAPAAIAPLPAANGAAANGLGVPLQQYATVWQKPLFNPDRQPLVGAGTERNSVGDFTLTGVIMTPTLHLALLHDRNGDRELRVHEGEASADGSVTLVQVRPRSAVFDSSQGRVELQLPAGAPLAPAPEAAGAQAAHGPAMDSHAMAAMTPPSGAEGLPGGLSEPQPTGMQMAGPISQPPPPVPAAVGSARQAGHHAAPAGVAERLRAAVQQRRAARAAVAPQGDR